MNKRFLLAWLVLFIVWFFGSFINHGVLLHNDYMQMRGLFRTEQDSQAFFPYMILAHVMMSGAFAWIYARGVEGRPWVGQGLRYGVAVALLMIVPLYLIYYVVQPMPGATVAKQIALETILVLVLGLVVAFMYRKPA